MEFKAFPKITRLLEQDVIITEKLDGTNGVITIFNDVDLGDTKFTQHMLVGSRNRWITPEDDNYGFARWCEENKKELLTLGEGTHYGEWWGQGIQRKYGMSQKVFSLFNVSRWNSEDRPECCDVVPTLYEGKLTPEILHQLQTNTLNGEASEISQAALAYNVEFEKPEGYMLWMSKGCQYYKIPLDK